MFIVRDCDWQFAASNFKGFFLIGISLIGTRKIVRKTEFFEKSKFEKSVIIEQ